MASTPPTKALVTGGTGFIGRRLVHRLTAEIGPTSVVCLANTPRTLTEASTIDAYRASGIQVIESDLLRRPVSPTPPSPFDVIFHLAANIDTGAPESELRVNDEGTRNLLDWLAPVSRGARIVYASSVAVHDRVAEPGAPIAENSPFVPRTAYGRSKLRGETIVRERAAYDSYAWTILRLPTVYGSGQKPNGLFGLMLNTTLRSSLLRRINWPGHTSIIHVDDVAEVMVALATMPEAAAEAYCVASDESFTVGELAQQIGRAAGNPVNPIDIPIPIWRLIRRLVWSRVVRAATPLVAYLFLWQLSLIVSDGFFYDTSKFRSIYTQSMRPLSQWLRELRAASQGEHS